MVVKLAENEEYLRFLVQKEDVVSGVQLKKALLELERVMTKEDVEVIVGYAQKQSMYRKS